MTRFNQSDMPTGGPSTKRAIGVASLDTERCSCWFTYGLLVLLPLGTYQAIGSPAVSHVLKLYVTPALYLSDLAVGGLLLLAVLRKASARPPPCAAFTAPLLALPILATLTIPLAIIPILALYTALRWWVAFGLYWSLQRSTVPLDKLVRVFLLGLSLQALVGVGQVIAQRPLGLPGEMAMYPAQSGAAVVTVQGTRLLRAYGLAFHPNVLGGLFMIGLLLGLPQSKSLPMRGLWWLLWSGLLLTFSRSAWLATALTMPLVIGWLARYRPVLRRSVVLTLVGAVLLGSLFMVVYGGAVASRLRPAGIGTEVRSLDERGELQGVALGVIAARPLSGVGAGNFPLVVRNATRSAAPQPVHNVTLLLASEVGVLGGALWLWLCLAAGVALVQCWRGSSDSAVVLLACWLGLGIVSLFDSYPWTLNSGQLCSAVLLGLASRALALPSPSPPQNIPAHPSPGG